MDLLERRKISAVSASRTGYESMRCWFFRGVNMLFKASCSQTATQWPQRMHVSGLMALGPPSPMAREPAGHSWTQKPHWIHLFISTEIKFMMSPKALVQCDHGLLWFDFRASGREIIFSRSDADAASATFRGTYLMGAGYAARCGSSAFPNHAMALPKWVMLASASESCSTSFRSRPMPRFQ